jgi:hypothetical protein
LWFIISILIKWLSKKRAVLKRFFLQPLMPLFINSEHYDGKRYKCRRSLNRLWFWRPRFARAIPIDSTGSISLRKPGILIGHGIYFASSDRVLILPLHGCGYGCIHLPNWIWKDISTTDWSLKKFVCGTDAKKVCSHRGHLCPSL